MKTKETYLYSNEIVFRGHPDKTADQISDALLDAYLAGDKHSRCGIEVVGGKGKIFVTGEVTSNTNVDVEAVVKRVLADIGYSTDYEVIDNIGKQSADIALGTNDDVGGAGDQGMMFGYACNETPEYLPVAQVILQTFSKWYDELRKHDSRFLADGKAQITGLYDNDRKLIKIKDFTVSYQNTEEDRETTDNIIKAYLDALCEKFGVEIEQWHINPTGKFLIGGFDGDAGLTGRKIVVDNYQSFANVGGGAFSGKDPTKVDRSAAYKARNLAIKIMHTLNCKWCEVQLSYAIGMKFPLAIYAKTDIGSFDFTSDIKTLTECTPKAIIDEFGLVGGVKYEDTAKFGHFGNKAFSWETI